MNILLTGGSSSLIDSMILKLRKEGHRVFILTGDKYKHNKYEKVFEKYEFPYDSENLNEILESVNPDVTILMGAFDTNYYWNGEERENVRFVSHLVNILVAHSRFKKTKLIFLSSDEVYSGNYAHDIEEDEKFSGSGLKAECLSQAEEMCRNFSENRGMDLIVLRLDHFYGIPKGKKDLNHIVDGMCLECLRDGYIKAGTDHEFSMLYEKDAVEYIYQVVKRKKHEHFLYHLSSSDVVSELELAAMIQDEMKSEANIITVPGGDGRCVLSGSRFEREYGVHAFCDWKKAVKDIVSYMQRHKGVFLKDDELKKPWWKRLWEKWKWLLHVLFPFMENLACFIPFFMLDNRTVGYIF